MGRKKKKELDLEKIDEIRRQYRSKPMAKEDVAAKVYAQLAVARAEFLSTKDLSERERVEYEYDCPVIPALSEDKILDRIALLKHFNHIDIKAQAKIVAGPLRKTSDEKLLSSATRFVAAE